MEKQELEKRLEETKANLISNSKDARFAKKLISDLISLKGQIDLQPIQTEDIGEVVDELEGQTFVIRKHELGVSYHQYNSMDVRIKANITSAYEFISSMIDHKKDYETLTKEEKEAFDITLSAMGYILATPTFAFSDETFFFELASFIVKFLREKTDELLNAPLQPETVDDLKKNEAFEEAVMAVEQLAEETKKTE